MVLRDKTTGDINLYRPKGLSLVDLVNERNITPLYKAFFLKQKKASSEYYNLTKAYIFITRLMWGEITQRYFHEAKHWVNLSSSSLRNVIGRGKEVEYVTKLLVELNVIEINHAYSTNRFSKSYRFTDHWQNAQRELVPEPYSISKAKEKYFAQETKPRCEVVDDVSAYLLKHLRKITLAPEVDDYVQRRRYRNDDGLKYAYDYLDAIREFERGDVQFSRAERTGRLDTVLTRIHRDVRHWLRYDDEPLYEVDMVASQPFLLLALYNEQHPDGALDEERSRWLSLWEDGDLYESLRSYPDCDSLTRDDIKQAIVQGGLNAKSPHKAPPVIRKPAKAIMAIIQREFPRLHRAIHDLKTRRDADQFPNLEVEGNGNEKVFSQFALKLQRIESKVMIDGACALLMPDDVPIYTIHDGIGCRKRDVKRVKSAIIKATKEVVGEKPLLTAKRPALQSA